MGINSAFKGLICRLNGTSAYYKASPKTQTSFKNSANTQKQNTKQTKQKMSDRKQYKTCNRTKDLNPGKKHRQVDTKNSQISAEFVLKKQWVS